MNMLDGPVRYVNNNSGILEGMYFNLLLTANVLATCLIILQYDKQIIYDVGLRSDSSVVLICSALHAV